MWGNILTEVSYLQNFNMTFTNNKSDVLIHLTQWQYWWWFWFSFLWALYYLLIARVFRYRTLKFNPRIASTLRPHGKWGDLLTCIIPVTWCLNILLNSNFILRIIEWQSESSLFTLRVRAKQWYWIYKLDLRNINDIFSTPQNIGKNKWRFATFGGLKTAEDYLHLIQMRAYNSWSKEFWTDFEKKSTKKNKFNNSISTQTYKTNFLNNNSLFKNRLKLENTNLTTSTHNLFEFNTNVVFKTKLLYTKEIFNKPNLNTNTFSFLGLGTKQKTDHFVFNFDQNFFKKTLTVGDTTKNKTFNEGFGIKTFSKNKNQNFEKFLKNVLFNNTQSLNFKHVDLDDESRIVKRNSGKITPLRVLKNPLKLLDTNQTSTTINLLQLRFNDHNPTISSKPIKSTVYLTFKQKRYNQRVNIGKKSAVFFNKITEQKETYSGNPFLKNISIIEENFGNPTRQYKLVKKSKNRVDNIRIANWNRLLRARRVLVLPAHVNITVITNSFDLVHSWHIPGLGLKMDCLPGRATHHTLYIDNVGLYYGQCAEICGRYHHHMPIRICALPFEHFLVWWHTFGLPKFLFPTDKEKNLVAPTKYFTRKFSW